MTEKQKKFESPDQDIEKWEERHPVVQSSLPSTVGPMEIMMEAVRKGSGKEVLEQLQGMFEFQKQVDAEEARKAHFDAVARFKEEAPPVKKDKWNDWLKCWYTSLGQLLDTYNPYLGKQGLSLSFAPPEQDENKMTVECLLAHRMGHVTSVKMTGPIDKAAVGKQSGKPSRNAMQDLRSTFTYLRSTTCEAILGVSGTEATQDDDGNTVGGQVDEFITEDEAKKITFRVKALFGEDTDLFMTWLKSGTGADTIDTIPSKNLADIQKTLTEQEAAAKKKPQREPGQEG